MDLLDVNVWLPLTLADHVHHARAKRYWEHEAAPRAAFCRVTALAYLRLSTNASVMGGNPLTVSQAWSSYAALRALPEVVLLDEPEGCDATLEHWAAQSFFPAKLWTDAYLAAFARTAGLRLVSLDGDFTRFGGLSFLRLEP